jgi:hypothetical protein
LTDSPFRHAASATLKHILEKESRHITRADLEQALKWTIESLGHDVVGDSVPPPVLKARAEVRIPTMPSGHTEPKASTCSNLMPSTVLR